ncbi:hypothetical protein BDB01DRAFT_717091 [Pilobolus umbonatus]|nr:hypothetical protein BDB01DRAFT_717091 [Pilobolus umbonatus]
MITLRHNQIPAKELFAIENIMIEVSSHRYQLDLNYSLLNKSRVEVYGYMAGTFRRMGFFYLLDMSFLEFVDFLMDVEKGYKNNPYHSFYHAIDVTMVLHYMLEYHGMSRYLTLVDVAMLLIAALCHDIGHPGRNNQFQIHCGTGVAKEFSNKSVLESYSAKLTLDILNKHGFLDCVEPKSSLFDCPITTDNCKKGIVKMILATDMICHRPLMENISTLKFIIDHGQIHHNFNRLMNISSHHNHSPFWLRTIFTSNENPFPYFRSRYFRGKSRDRHADIYQNRMLNYKERLMLCRVLIHAADISNPCRPWTIYHQLSNLVCIEFFSQGDEEYKLGLPVSDAMNRKKNNLSSVNVEFIDLVVHPYFKKLVSLFPQSIELMRNCINNRKTLLSLTDESNEIIPIGYSPIQKQQTGTSQSYEENGLHKKSTSHLWRHNSPHPPYNTSGERRRSDDLVILTQ